MGNGEWGETLSLPRSRVPAILQVRVTDDVRLPLVPVFPGPEPDIRYPSFVYDSDSDSKWLTVYRSLP